MNLLSEMTNEEFRLFNPAYCGYLLYSTISEYQNSNKEFPCTLIYLVLPMIMTKYVTDHFPRDTRTVFLSCANQNQDCIIDFDTRVADYFDVTQNALDFLLAFKAINISESGYISTSNFSISRTPSFFNKSNAMSSHLLAAKFLGRWFVNYEPVTIYSVLGIKP